MVFAANQHTRWSIVAVRRRQLTTRNLNEEVRAWIGWFAPLAHDVVQSEVELVVCEHLWDASVLGRSGDALSRTFSALLNASPVGS